MSTETVYKGIFWIITNQANKQELITVKVLCDLYGSPLENVEFSSKSGENFNHKLEWANLSKTITQGKPYNYYPRGRVEIKKGKAILFCPPNLCQELYLSKIKNVFHINNLCVNVKADGSKHYESQVFL